MAAGYPQQPAGRRPGQGRRCSGRSGRAAAAPPCAASACRIAAPATAVGDPAVRRRAFRRRLRLCLGAVWAAASLHGCGDDAARQAAPPPPVGAGPAMSVACAGADLSGLRSVVHVASDGSDGDACGATTASACATIQHGIDRCAGAGCGVLVRHGLYRTTATLALRDGVSVYGSCVRDGEPDRGYRSVVDAAPPAGEPAVAAVSIAAPTVVHGLVVVRSDETAAGSASIAMAVSRSSGLALSRTVLSAGRGGDGAAGAPGGNGAPGQPGGGGGWADDHQGGWIGVAGTPGPGCPGADGGRGADRLGVSSRDDIDGMHCSYGGGDGGNAMGTYNPSGYGYAGIPGRAGPQCPSRDENAQQGQTGGDGRDGDCPQSASAHSPRLWGAGVSAQGRWQPAFGADGGGGTPGGGGGGGGAGGVCAILWGFYVTDYHGMPGGGGGGGGCGGGAGGGGQQGGASIALLLTGSTLAGGLESNQLVPGPGGRGGDGNRGGDGGARGARGPGGGVGWLEGQVCRATVPNGSRESGFGGLGGDGGLGGHGGAGGGGSGGNGGPAIALALAAAASAPAAGAAAYLGRPGMGGAGGGSGAAPQCGVGPGEAGVGGGTAAMADLDRPPDNVLAAGETLQQKQSKTSPDGAYKLNMQTDGNFCLDHHGYYRWCSQQVLGVGAARAAMQADGNFCLQKADGSGAWCTGTAGHAGAYLALENDGSVVVRDGSELLATLP